MAARACSPTRPHARSAPLRAGAWAPRRWKSRRRASIRSELAPRWRELLSTVVLEPATAAAGDLARAAWDEGERMSFDEAIRYARTFLPVVTAAPGLRSAPPAPARRPPGGLTSRELEIAELVAQGMTNRQVAERLGVAERTAEGHVERIRRKLGVRTRTQIAIAVLKGQGVRPGL